ncbi:MAG: hypothetical protein WB609_06740 [Candidatus Cybelea sp.]
MISAALFSAVLMVGVPGTARAAITITLNNKFIDEYANRATMTASVHIDAAAPKPHANNVDGDEHAAGTSDAIGLAAVVEIMNANLTDEGSGVGDLENSVGKNVSITGYWRIWPEHGGTGNDFTQGGTVAPIDNTNPPHVFEIHPILSIDGFSLQSSLMPIADYQPKNALDAFQAYDRTSCKITGDANTTTITTDMVGYNYVRYRLALTDQSVPRKTADGGIEFFAQVEDPDAGDLIANEVRMIAAPGSEIATRISSMHNGDSLVVWGIPRVDLSLVRYRATHPNARDWNLPYEMILVAIDQGS